MSRRISVPLSVPGRPDERSRTGGAIRWPPKPSGNSQPAWRSPGYPSPDISLSPHSAAISRTTSSTGCRALAGDRDQSPQGLFMRGEPRGIVANAGGKNAHETGSKWHELAPFTHQLRFFVHKKAENPQFPAKGGKVGGSAWIFLPRAFFMRGEALAVRMPPIWFCVLTAFIAHFSAWQFQPFSQGHPALDLRSGPPI